MTSLGGKPIRAIAALSILSSYACDPNAPTDATKSPEPAAPKTRVEAPKQAAPEAQAPPSDTPTSDEECAVAYHMVTMNSKGEMDLGPFVSGIRASFGEELIICGKPNPDADEACKKYLDELNPTFPDGFYFFDAATGALDVSVGGATPQSWGRISPGTCEQATPPLTKENCTERTQSFFKGYIEGVSGGGNEAELLTHETMLDVDDGVTSCNGLGNIRVSTPGTEGSPLTVYHHAYFTLRSHPSHSNMFTLAVYMPTLEGSDNAKVILEHVAQAVDDTMNTLDLSTRATMPSK